MFNNKKAFFTFSPLIVTRYENEAYFYEALAPLVTDINIPKNFGVIRDHNGVPAGMEKIGIVMEDLRVYKGVFGMDLNKNVKLLLQVVSEIFKLHDKFYFPTQVS